MNLSKKVVEELVELARPLQKWLKDNAHIMCYINMNTERIEVSETQAGSPFNDSKDAISTRANKQAPIRELSVNEIFTYAPPKVRAFKIGKIEGNKLFIKGSDSKYVSVSNDFMTRYPLNLPGYYVVYPDGGTGFLLEAEFNHLYTGTSTNSGAQEASWVDPSFSAKPGTVIDPEKLDAIFNAEHGLPKHPNYGGNH